MRIRDDGDVGSATFHIGIDVAVQICDVEELFEVISGDVTLLVQRVAGPLIIVLGIIVIVDIGIRLFEVVSLNLLRFKVASVLDLIDVEPLDALAALAHLLPFQDQLIVRDRPQGPYFLRWARVCLAGC